MMQEQSDAIGLAIGKTATYGGGTSAFLFGLSANELAAIVGAAVAIIGLCVQWHYNRRRDRRDVEYHTARMADLRERDE